MNYQTEYPLIKLTCRVCYTKDIGDTFDHIARRRGWTEIDTKPAPMPRVHSIHRWWTHLGFCPKCTNDNLRRRKENQQMSTKATRVLLNAAMVTTILVGAVVLMSKTTQAATPPATRPQPDDMGACCYGSRFEVAYTSRLDCNTGKGSPTGRPGMFVNGAVPTADENPCTVIPGGD